jgi:hypothetical protein
MASPMDLPDRGVTKRGATRRDIAILILPRSRLCIGTSEYNFDDRPPDTGVTVGRLLTIGYDV